LKKVISSLYVLALISSSTCSVSQLYGALWAIFAASVVETQETPENIKGDHDNPEPAPGCVIRNGILLQLLVWPKFRRSNKKLSVSTYISMVTVL
jgi:hypothetical protein